MAKTTFTAAQLEAAINKLDTVDHEFSEYPLLVLPGSFSSVWDEGFFPRTFRKIGSDENVRVDVKDFFYGEEGGDHRMYIILQVGWGDTARYFEKSGEYNSWDASAWDGGFVEVEQKEVTKTEWVTKK